ncbi:hypothetical protein, partial [Burkholderia sp.]|uniref:hypothetical protein n=1 Tax=Burkholderia sp. TaxID=36773 RepID=UPI00338DF77E
RTAGCSTCRTADTGRSDGAIPVISTATATATATATVAVARTGTAAATAACAGTVTADAMTGIDLRRTRSRIGCA